MLYTHWLEVHATEVWQALTAGQSVAWQHVAPTTHAPLQHTPPLQLPAEQGALTHAPFSHACPDGQEVDVHAHPPDTQAGVDDAHAVQETPQCVPSSFA